MWAENGTWCLWPAWKGRLPPLPPFLGVSRMEAEGVRALSPDPQNQQLLLDAGLGPQPSCLGSSCKLCAQQPRGGVWFSGKDPSAPPQEIEITCDIRKGLLNSCFQFDQLRKYA